MKKRDSFGSLKGVVISIAMLMIFWAASSARADIVINEVLGSTASTDWEFIELYNTGTSDIDISGWFIELWDSDNGSTFGLADADSPYVIDDGTTISAGGYFLLANELAETGFGVTADQALPSNAIENSSYTMILKDSTSSTINSVFVTDGGDGDAANDNGTLITADLVVGPDGSYLPAGFYRITDGSDDIALLEYSFPISSATPGSINAVPVPAAIWLFGTGLIGLVGVRKKIA